MDQEKYKVTGMKFFYTLILLGLHILFTIKKNFRSATTKIMFIV